MNGPKVDWFCGVGDFADNGAEPKPPPLPTFEDGADLLDAEVPLPREIVAGILHQGAKMALGGSSKSYKTHLLIDLAVGVATGRGWLGFLCAKLRVLYINLEIARPFFRRRLKRILKKRGLVLPPGALDVWNLRGHDVTIRDVFEKLVAWIRPGEYGLVIIDPVYKLYGEENETREIKRVLAFIERIAGELGAAVAWAAHFSKGNQADKEAIDRICGSGIWGRDPDSILTFTRHEENECYIVQSTLRDFPAQDDFAVRFDDGLVVRDGKLDPAKFKRPNRGRPASYTPEELAAILADDELTTTEFCQRAVEQTGMGRQTFFRIKKQASELNLISLSRISGKWEKCQVSK